MFPFLRELFSYEYDVCTHMYHVTGIEVHKYAALTATAAVSVTNS